MAVTYSWRIDTDKYAYIVPPLELITATTGTTGTLNEDWKKYGYLTNAPLTDYFARFVAEKAEQLFGQDKGSDGLMEYQKAFKVVESKISAASKDAYTYRQRLSGQSTVDELRWWNLGESYDMLSADVYFNVDAAQCADLRGVGIKGTKYLGSIPKTTYVTNDSITQEEIIGVELDDMAYLPAGTAHVVTGLTSNGEITTKQTTIQPGIPGYVDVYGIYLTDNITDKDGNEIGKQTPEYMFVIRNGKDGARGNAGSDGSDGENTGVSRSEFNKLQAQVNNLQTTVNNLLNSIGSVVDLWNDITTNGGLSGILETISKLNGDYNELRDAVTEYYPTNGGGSDDPDTGGTGGGSTKVQIQYLYRNGEIPTGTTINDELEENGDWGETGYNIKDPIYLLGYIPTDPGDNSAVKASKLIALPYISVSEGQIDFKTNVRVGGKLLTTGDFQSKSIIYGEKGFYQDDGFSLDEQKITKHDFNY